MNARDELLRAVQRGMSDVSNWPDDVGYKLLGVNMSKPQNAVVESVLAAGYTKPRIITTVEELATLPLESVVMDASQRIGELFSVSRNETLWAIPGDAREIGGEDLNLPATVLYEPQS